MKFRKTPLRKQRLNIPFNWETRDEYVAEFDRLNGLKPTRIVWVTPDYCFG
jgi:hypothetical protein